MEKHMPHRIALFSLVTTALIALTAGSYAWFQTSQVIPVTLPEPSRMETTTPLALSPASLPNFAAIVKQNGPAVVNISVSGMTKVTLPTIPSFDANESPTDYPRRYQPQLPKGEAPTHGLSSGFIFRSDGLVITNAHVVDGAADITVKLTDKREYKATLLGIDKLTDLALVKIEAQDLPTVRVGDPAQSGVGDWVLAIGSPFGFANSVTAGIISAKGRSLPEEGYVPFIQTDVAINPGNSGGPLFNLNGEVIGVNSQIYSHSGGYQGVSFAIPIDLALSIEQQFVRDGKVSRGWLGVSLQNLDQGLADSFGLPNPLGVLVDVVESESPAAKAGILPGDIILQVDGHDLAELNELTPVMANLKPGLNVRVRIWRDGNPREIPVQVSQLKESTEEAADLPELGHNALGLAVRPLTPDESRKLDVVSGLLVEQSVGAAAEASIQPGDVVLALNGHPLTETEQLRNLVTGAQQHVALLIQRGSSRLFVSLDLG
jgi:serine protease Do